MSKNLDQIFTANPITTNASTDLMYFMQSPYNSGTDAAMTFANFSAQFTSGSVTPAEIQHQDFTTATSSSNIGNDYSATFSPAFTLLSGGELISFQAPAANTNNQQNQHATLNVDGLGAALLYINSDGTLIPAWEGALGANGTYECLYDITHTGWIILNPSNMVTGDLLVNQNWTYGVDSTGSANVYQIAIPTLILDASGNIIDGAKVSFKSPNANTGASTLTVNGTTANIILDDGTALVGGEILSNGTYECTNNVSLNGWVLLNSSAGGVTATQVQENAFNQGVDSGIANAYDVAVTPAITTPYNGMLLVFEPQAGNNSSTVTIALNGGTAKGVYSYNASLPQISDIEGANPTFLIFSTLNDAWFLINPQQFVLFPNQVTRGNLTYYPDQGVAANVYVATFGVVGYPQPSVAPIPGMPFNFLPANTNTGASTLNYDGNGALPILYNGIALVGGEMVATQMSLIFYDGTQYQLINSYRDNSKTIFTPMTGDTVTLLSTNYISIINPAGTLATLTVDMPATPVDGQKQRFSFTQIITSLTVTGGGNTIVGTPTAAAISNAFEFIFNVGDSTWYPA